MIYFLMAVQKNQSIMHLPNIFDRAIIIIYSEMSSHIVPLELEGAKLPLYKMAV